ncbi:MAG: histidinol-phosphate transaminase [Luteibaculaceae bacterium]
MFSLEKLVRPSITALKAYQSARDEFTGVASVYLDANENPYGMWNRYPDPYQSKLKTKISKLKKVEPKHIFVGNGSDEAIDLIFRIFCEPGTDVAVGFKPSYGMYKVSAAINNVKYVEVPLLADYNLNLPVLLESVQSNQAKVLFLCSPNNPTGNVLKEADVVTLLQKCACIVVIDEAYIDFANEPSWLNRLNEFPNLVILQTFSKAWGLAAARVGMAFGSAEIISLFNKVKPPYNVSEPAQKAALKALSSRTQFKQRLRKILNDKQKLVDELTKLSGVETVYAGSANFVLISVKDPNQVYAALLSKGIVVRNRNSELPGYLRITVGSTKENKILINALKSL